MPDGGIADLSFAVQSAKGTAAASAAYRTYLAGGGLGPVRAIATLDDRDTTGFAQRVGAPTRYVDGEPEIFARPEPLGLWLYGALGAKAVSGAGPFTHTITPSATLPWLTFWRMLANGLLVEQFVDCKIASLRIKSSAGSPLRVSARVLSGISRRRSANQVTTVTTSAPFEHRHGSGALKVNGAAVSAISDVDILIDNGLRVRPGGLGGTWVVVGGADRKITAVVRQAVVNAALYDEFHYDTQSPPDNTLLSVNTETAALDFLWTIAAGTTLRIQIPLVVPTSVDGWDVSTSHAYLQETRSYEATKGGSAAMTATLVNGVASY